MVLIDYFFHHPCFHLVTFAWFQSNMHNLRDLFLPNKITCYVCVLLFCLKGALFNQQNQHEVWNVMKILAFFYSYYVLNIWDSTSKCIYCLIWLRSFVGLTFFTLHSYSIFAMGAGILTSLPKWHLKGVKWLVQFLGFSE